MAFLLTVLKLAPYEDENDDLASFVSSLTITLTLLVGFALISDTKSDPTFDPEIFSVLLVVILVSCLVFEIGLMIFTDWGLGDFLKRKLGNCEVQKPQKYMVNYLKQKPETIVTNVLSTVVNFE